MADDSIEIVEDFDFHPCNTPRGMLYYDMNVLTAVQQQKLNSLKRKVVREDEEYLADHPEVRAIVSLILQYLFKYQPRTDLQEFVAAYFTRPQADIQNEIDNYIALREPHMYKGDSAVIEVYEDDMFFEDLVFMESKQPLTKEEKEEMEEKEENVPLEVLNEIVIGVFAKLEEEEALCNIELVKDIIRQEVLDKLPEKSSEEIKDLIIKELLKKVIQSTTSLDIFGSNQDSTNDVLSSGKKIPPSLALTSTSNEEIEASDKTETESATDVGGITNGNILKQTIPSTTGSLVENEQQQMLPTVAEEEDAKEDVKTETNEGA